jgi:hypothetical protein
MYPTTVTAVLVIAAAIQCARRPDAGRFRLVRYLSVLAGLVSSLSFVSGVIKSFTAAGQVDAPDAFRFALIGVGESLYNIGLGLVALVIAWGVTCWGAYRAGAPAGRANADLVDPHRP